jgi:hypothetical protein
MARRYASSNLGRGTDIFPTFIVGKTVPPLEFATRVPPPAWALPNRTAATMGFGAGLGQNAGSYLDWEASLVIYLLVAARLLLPLLIPRYPLLGILSCMILDSADQSIMQAFGIDFRPSRSAGSSSISAWWARSRSSPSSSTTRSCDAGGTPCFSRAT